MKKVIFSILILGASVSHAKVADFNALINENMDAQKELHQEMQNEMGAAKAALNEKRTTTVIVEAKGADINVPTNSRVTRFKKEIVDHQPSQKHMNQRLATEIKSADMEF